MMIPKWKMLAATMMLFGLLASTVRASPSDVWSLSGDWSLASNPAPPVDPGAAGGGTGTWSYHSGGAPDIFGVPGPVSLYGLTSSGDISASVNGELPDAGDVWQHTIGNHIVLGKYTTASVFPSDNTDFLPGNVGGHAATGATWTTDHAGTFQVNYLGYNARANNAGGLVFMDLIDPVGPTLLNRTALNPDVPGKWQGIANANHQSTVLTLAAGEGVRFIMTNNDWSGMDMTITEIVDSPPVLYTIDETLSSFTVSGTALGMTLEGQGGAASLTSNLEGTILANTNGSAMTFLGGSDIDVKQNFNAPFSPAGAGEDNFGGKAGFLADAAVRDAIIDIVSGTATFGGSVSSLEIEIASGKIDFDAGLLGSGSSDLTGDRSSNQSTDPLLKSIIGNVETITIPIIFPLQDDNFDLLIQGQIVATRTIQVGVLGDYNSDGTVNAADYTVWRDTLGSTSDLDADGNNNGMIDQGDYDIWDANFGNSSSEANTVPEPSALLLIGVGNGLACLSRSRRLR